MKALNFPHSVNAIVASKTVTRSMQILFVPKNDQSDYKLVPDNDIRYGEQKIAQFRTHD